MAVLSTQNYIVSSTQVVSGPYGTAPAGTLLTINIFQPLVTFPFPVEILGMTLNRSLITAPTAAVTLTAAYAPVATSASAGATACSAALAEPTILGAVVIPINDNGVTDTTSPKYAKPIIVPVGNSIGFIVSNHAITTSQYNGWSILYRPALT